MLVDNMIHNIIFVTHMYILVSVLKKSFIVLRENILSSKIIYNYIWIKKSERC